jgi:hypothetical protein
MDRDNRTRTGAKDPWGREAEGLPHSGSRKRGQAWTLSQASGFVAEAGEGSTQTVRGGAYAGSGLTTIAAGKARPDRLALKPYWGKPAVRNFRGGDGDVGIMRSPVRAIALPDGPRPAPAMPTTSTP